MPKESKIGRPKMPRNQLEIDQSKFSQSQLLATSLTTDEQMFRAFTLKQKQFLKGIPKCHGVKIATKKSQQTNVYVMRVGKRLEAILKKRRQEQQRKQPRSKPTSPRVSNKDHHKLRRPTHVYPQRHKSKIQSGVTEVTNIQKK